MPLNVGSRLGHYEVTTLIGEGGMGQVYQATDTKLNRQVALKILPEAFAADPDRLARFQREAQVLASLNHPNIAAIYGLEEADDTRALVLELVEGPTVADRIAKGPIPLDASYAASRVSALCFAVGSGHSIRSKNGPHVSSRSIIRAREISYRLPPASVSDGDARLDESSIPLSQSQTRGGS